MPHGTHLHHPIERPRPDGSPPPCGPSCPSGPHTAHNTPKRARPYAGSPYAAPSAPVDAGHGPRPPPPAHPAPTDANSDTITTNHHMQRAPVAHWVSAMAGPVARAICHDKANHICSLANTARKGSRQRRYAHTLQDHARLSACIPRPDLRPDNKRRQTHFHRRRPRPGLRCKLRCLATRHQRQSRNCTTTTTSQPPHRPLRLRAFTPLPMTPRR